MCGSLILYILLLCTRTTSSPNSIRDHAAIFLFFHLRLKIFREDAGVDPNRDFPYSREDNECLRSSTGRLFNAIMRANLIQIVVTFHGGMVAIGYEWGKCFVSHVCL